MLEIKKKKRNARDKKKSLITEMKNAFDGFISRLHNDFGVGKYFLRKWKTSTIRETLIIWTSSKLKISFQNDTI